MGSATRQTDNNQEMARVSENLERKQNTSCARPLANPDPRGRESLLSFRVAGRLSPCSGNQGTLQRDQVTWPHGGDREGRLPGTNEKSRRKEGV